MVQLPRAQLRANVHRSWDPNPGHIVHRPFTDLKKKLNVALRLDDYICLDQSV